MDELNAYQHERASIVTAHYNDPCRYIPPRPYTYETAERHVPILATNEAQGITELVNFSGR